MNIREKCVFILMLTAFVMISVNLKPTYGADEAAMQKLKEKVVLANKILAAEKLATPFGHVSVRIPGTETFLISRSAAPGMVNLDDILVCDLNGKILEGKYKDTYSEVPIHTEVYKKRKDVNSVVHTHSSYAIALSMTDHTVVPFFSTDLGPQPIALYKKKGLIHKPEQGAAICDLMGPNKAVILKGHGAVIIGNSIEEAVCTARNLENAAELQWKAMCLGKLVPIAEEETKTSVEPAQKKTGESGEGLHGVQREWAYYEYLLKK